jgi:hypothetical protein
MIPMSFSELLGVLFLKCGCSEKCSKVFVAVTTLIGFYTMVAWNIIGYTQYFSAENHCAGGWMWVMGFLLFVGAFFIMAGACLMCQIAALCSKYDMNELISKTVYSPKSNELPSEMCYICCEDLK